MERFEAIGNQIIHRAGGGMMDGNPYSAALSDGFKRKIAAGLLGQAFVVAYNTVSSTSEGTDYVADRLMRAGELYGDDVMRCSTTPGSRSPRSTSSTRTHGPRSDPAALPRRPPLGRRRGGARARPRARGVRAAAQGGLWSHAPRGRPRRPTSRRRSRPRRRRRRERGDSPYRSRFGLVLGALIGVAIATLAIGAAVYVGTDANNGAPKGWSTWKPDTDDGVKASHEIATHVGRSTGSTTATRSSACRAGRSRSPTSRSTSRCAPRRRAATSTSSTARA